MSERHWEFWIDVGGTFTDCLARSDAGTRCQFKLLSSGVFKGRVAETSQRDVIVDPARTNDPARFWIGWKLVIVNSDGTAVDRATVSDYDSRTGSLYVRGLRSDPKSGASYELQCDLDAPVIAIRYLLGLTLDEVVPPISLRLGTTRGTNALLTRSGARTALATTRGFGDVLEIGYQARPRLFELAVKKPPVLAIATIEIVERVSHDGHVLVPLQHDQVRRQLESLHEVGITSLAVCLMNADRHPRHEQAVARIAREVGFHEISCSSDVAVLPKFVARADTTTLDAYLNPVLRDYIGCLRGALPGSQLRLLTSAGGLVAAESFSGRDCVLSGPAGGVVGFARVAEAAGFAHAIGFDMGGTSTDVSRFDGRFELEYESEKAGVKVIAPTMAIETVAAGGGSICRYDGVKLVVGPESAGADPGPACYGRGGPLTITDVNFYLGRILPDRFPFPLDRRATERRLAELASVVNKAEKGISISLDDLATGLLRIADANMAAAIRLVTVSKGANPSEYVLVAFGGAASQHACAVARELGIRTILNHPQAGVLSALGIGLGAVTRHHSCGVELLLSTESLLRVSERLKHLERSGIAELTAEGIARDRISVVRSLDLRYEGVDSCLTIEWPTDDDFAAAFSAEHMRRYGYTHGDRPLEIAAARVEVMGHSADGLPRSDRHPERTPASNRNVSLYVCGTRWEAPVFDRADLAAGHRINGPAIVVEEIATTVIDPGWRAEVLSGGELLLTDAEVCGTRFDDESFNVSAPNSHAKIACESDPVFLEIFNNLLVGIAEQMGAMLRNTASSVNVKERLDFSCAIFTADGRLVANAPHVPVHLGAMEETVQRVMLANPDLRPGDIVATNDPYEGGSHLPDITVISPVHDAKGELLFVVANRAHHAEIGGISPGSMPPLSRSLADEGVLLQNLKIVAEGVPQLELLRERLSSGRYPSRNVEANLADVIAQIAANRQGTNDLLALVDRYSWAVVYAYLEYVQNAAERKVRMALAKLPVGKHRFTDYLETADGSSVAIAVCMTIHPPGARYAATIDFTGTGPVVAGNLNANRAIVTAAVIYVLRVLLQEAIPLNHGVVSAIDIIVPESLLSPKAGATLETTPAVAGGNVETSQRIVDVLLGALRLAGASQGTMNNLLFGDETFGYYETICGGSGATAECDGASAVQVHMTNTRITDPEILERRYPARVLEFSVRRGSGGSGNHRGGDGVVRRIEFLKPLTLSLVTQRRGPHPPYGMAGGKPGALGRNTLIRADGTVVDLAGIAQFEVGVGDVLVIETPGGGGYGEGAP